MCNAHEDYADRFAERVAPNSLTLMRFGRIVLELGPENLHAALVKRLGVGWKKLYKEAREAHSWWG